MIGRPLLNKLIVNNNVCTVTKLDVRFYGAAGMSLVGAIVFTGQFSFLVIFLLLLGPAVSTVNIRIIIKERLKSVELFSFLNFIKVLAEIYFFSFYF